LDVVHFFLLWKLIFSLKVRLQTRSLKRKQDNTVDDLFRAKKARTVSAPHGPTQEYQNTGANALQTASAPQHLPPPKIISPFDHNVNWKPDLLSRLTDPVGSGANAGTNRNSGSSDAGSTSQTGRIPLQNRISERRSSNGPTSPPLQFSESEPSCVRDNLHNQSTPTSMSFSNNSQSSVTFLLESPPELLLPSSSTESQAKAAVKENDLQSRNASAPHNMIRVKEERADELPLSVATTVNPSHDSISRERGKSAARDGYDSRPSGDNFGKQRYGSRQEGGDAATVHHNHHHIDTSVPQQYTRQSFPSRAPLQPSDSNRLTYTRISDASGASQGNLNGLAHTGSSEGETYNSSRHPLPMPHHHSHSDRVPLPLQTRTSLPQIHSSTFPPPLSPRRPYDTSQSRSLRRSISRSSSRGRSISLPRSASNNSYHKHNSRSISPYSRSLSPRSPPPPPRHLPQRPYSPPRRYDAYCRDNSYRDPRAWNPPRSPRKFLGGSNCYRPRSRPRSRSRSRSRSREPAWRRRERM
jgi:hypothetical protein